ncbi:MAG: hypothetical protein GY796_26685 [Chloroflexi bacterium]|nr:hypothetical protein [Chloroflexota bacterium]
MILSKQDADLFFDLLWSLQFYVKQQLDLHPQVATLADYRDMDSEGRMEVRNAMWENPRLIADYVQSNPDNLSAEYLTIVNGWQNFVQGKCFIERLLKKYTVFIMDEKVYGVLGLYDPLEEMFPRQVLPLYVEAILLPFKGVIVYDGLLSSYRISFGGGMKRNLKNTYMKAKRKGEIIVSFDKATQAAHQAKTETKLKDWQPIINSLAQEAKSLRAQSGSPPSWGPTFSLVKASLAMAETAVAYPEDQDALWQQFDKVAQALDRLEKGIHNT